MRSAIVLVMHGMTPSDFPQEEKKEFMRLHAQVHNDLNGNLELKKRHDALEMNIRQWPRTEQNDLFYFAAKQIAESLENQSGKKVFLGFNEFCAPSFQEALQHAAESGAEEICVVTPMVTRGGVHSEVEIPQIIQETKKKYPNQHFSYAWPYQPEDTAQFLLHQLNSTIKPVTKS